MPSPISKGRMLRKDISRSEKFASLSKESQVLFCLLIPHLNTFGKMNGQPEFIKGECCPLVKWLNGPQIIKSMAEITRKTNVKWFKSGKLRYIHAIKWGDHQKFDKDRTGTDNLPSWSELSHGVLGEQSASSRSEVKLSKEKEKLSESATSGLPPTGALPSPLWSDDEKKQFNNKIKLKGIPVK